ncbi:hypothetical protein CGRA01v4_03914 [Colletotrichum graminicola]|nr:hypothetical protein CGRA01v4_03914 [Colletotrichum graminicola]
MFTATRAWIWERFFMAIFPLWLSEVALSFSAKVGKRRKANSILPSSSSSSSSSASEKRANSKLDSFFFSLFFYTYI